MKSVHFSGKWIFFTLHYARVRVKGLPAKWNPLSAAAVIFLFILPIATSLVVNTLKFNLNNKLFDLTIVLFCYSYADIAKSMKQEGAEADTVSEAEVNRGVMKEAPSDDAMVSMSPSYMSEASDAFGNSSYQPLSQVSVSAFIIISVFVT